MKYKNLQEKYYSFYKKIEELERKWKNSKENWRIWKKKEEFERKTKFEKVQRKKNPAKLLQVGLDLEIQVK